MGRVTILKAKGTKFLTVAQCLEKAGTTWKLKKKTVIVSRTLGGRWGGFHIVRGHRLPGRNWICNQEAAISNVLLPTPSPLKIGHGKGRGMKSQRQENIAAAGSRGDSGIAHNFDLFLVVSIYSSVEWANLVRYSRIWSNSFPKYR